MGKIKIDAKDTPKASGYKSLLRNEPENTFSEAIIKPDIQTSSNADIQTAKQAKERRAKYKDNPAYKMSTYYIKRDIETQLQLLSISSNRDLSDLVNEAISELLKKHS